MQYLEKLLAQFPDTPRSIVIKADVLRRGIRITADLVRAGTWAIARGVGGDVNPDPDAPSGPVPGQFHFCGDDTTVDILTDRTSPYEIKERSERDYVLCCGGEVLEEVTFTPRPEYYGKKTSDGTSVRLLLLQRGPHCITLNPLSFCEYYRKGTDCLFCCIAPLWEKGREAKVLQPFPRPETLAEAVAIAREEIDLRDLKLSGGGLYDTHKEAQLYEKALTTILERTGPVEEVTMVSQALAEDDQKRLKDAGVKNICFDLEVWDERLWDEVVPGKAQAIGRDEWLERLQKAVAIFGQGHVGCNFVAGVDAAPRPGFRTVDQSLESTLVGFKWLIERGIIPWFTMWTAFPGSRFHRKDPPPTGYYLRLGEGLHHLLMEHDMYPSLGFDQFGVDPPTLGYYCYYCYSFSFSRDYPRLMGRPEQPFIVA